MRSTLGGERDIRVGSAPTIYGERVVLRLMPDSETFNRIDDLGLTSEQRDLLERQLRRPYGMIIVAGPVGSGKCTIIYGCLDRLNDPTRSVTTIEDPVERRIEGINQIQVEPKVGFGFVEVGSEVVLVDSLVDLLVRRVVASELSRSRQGEGEQEAEQTKRRASVHVSSSWGRYW